MCGMKTFSQTHPNGKNKYQSPCIYISVHSYIAGTWVTSPSIFKLAPKWGLPLDYQNSTSPT